VHKAETVRIYGTFDGNIQAKKVVLTKAARMNGDICYGTIEIEPGAKFEGKVSRLNGTQSGRVFLPPLTGTRRRQALPRARCLEGMPAMGPFVFKRLVINEMDRDGEIEIKLTAFDGTVEFEYIDRAGVIQLRNWLTEQIERAK
jgi:hypothetical protein